MILAVLASNLVVMAEAPAYTYEAQKLVNPVTFDGKNDGEEWADAVKLVIDANNTTFQEYGRFQTDPRVATAEQLACTYYMKWDEEFLYICEERLDADGLHNPEVDPSGPWMGDGTAFFFADGTDLTRADIRWIAYTDANAKKCAVWSQPAGEEVTEQWQCAGGQNGNVYTIEFAMPWSVMDVQLTQEIKEGAEFRFCPIITSRGDDAMYGDWTTDVQINFYDGFHKYELENSENPEYYAGIKLTAANYQAPAAEVPAEVPADETPAEVPAADDTAADEVAPPPAPVVPAAPNTGDSTLMISLLLIAVLVAAGVTVKAKSRKSN